MPENDSVKIKTFSDEKFHNLPLEGYHALITGANRGIGAAISDTLARMGANLTLLGRNKPELRKKTDFLQKKHRISVNFEIADITEMKTVYDAVKTSVSVNGPISILVNNAGIAKSAPFKKMKQKFWDEILQVNLTGTFICSQAVLPEMLEAKYGRIINISSTAGLTGYGYVTAYSAAKHGVIGLTRSLALEVSKSGITVNAVCPGYTETDLVKQTIKNIVEKTGRTEEHARAELTASNPMGRLVQPSEVAETVAWLALPSSSAITGQAIPVAGGEIL
tara:strand:- start:377 stop:1210 length:834 start_codon:yes stop_codon:yes gene_type:complete